MSPKISSTLHAMKSLWKRSFLSDIFHHLINRSNVVVWINECLCYRTIFLLKPDDYRRSVIYWIENVRQSYLTIQMKNMRLFSVLQDGCFMRQEWFATWHKLTVEQPRDCFVTNRRQCSLTFIPARRVSFISLRDVHHGRNGKWCKPVGEIKMYYNKSIFYYSHCLLRAQRSKMRTTFVYFGVELWVPEIKILLRRGTRIPSRRLRSH